jgi:hypothetical protein
VTPQGRRAIVDNDRPRPLKGIGAVGSTLLVVALVSCNGEEFNAPCPLQPVKWTIPSAPTPLDVDPRDYPVAPPELKTSVDIELGQLYMRRRIAFALEGSPPADAVPESGIFVNDVRLEEHEIGGERLHLLVVRITPWLRGEADKRVSLQRGYVLRLKIVPYLITPMTLPSEEKRRALLQTTDRGAVLRFELVELYSLVNDEAVACSSRNYDRIDSGVLSGLYDSLAKQDPLVLPVAPLTGMVDGLVGASTNVVGMNLGSDRDLKIGLRFDRGAPGNFESHTSLTRYQSVDWGVSLDTSFVTAAIARAAAAEAVAQDPSARVTPPVVVTYRKSGIYVDVEGVLKKCGDIAWESRVHVTPLVRQRADGKSILVAPSTQTQTNSANLVSGSCFVFDQLLQSFGNPLGSATLTIRTGGECAFPMGDPIEFEAGAGDTFYATTVDTDEIFYVAGRSTFMDRLAEEARQAGEISIPRPPVEPCP